MEMEFELTMWQGQTLTWISLDITGTFYSWEWHIEGGSSASKRQEVFARPLMQTESLWYSAEALR